jgi:hypothetical protein
MDDLKARILEANDLPREPADVPWDLGGARLYVRGLTASEKDAYVARTMPDGEFLWTNNLTAELIVKCLVDEDGARVFTDEDAPALGGKGAAVLSKLFEKAMRLSGLSSETEEQVAADFGIGLSSPSATG